MESKLKHFLKEETVLCVALLLAACLCLATPTCNICHT